MVQTKKIQQICGLDRPIVLVGLMGAGKTSVGRELARRLDIPFIDSDSEIESISGFSIADIFEIYGEQEFRRLERLVFERLLESTPRVKVISAGGGTFVSETIRNNILNSAVSVWLNASVDVLVKRTALRPGKRPKLINADPQKVLTDLMLQRQGFYSMANLVVDAEDENAGQTARKVIDKLKDYCNMPKE